MSLLLDALKKAADDKRKNLGNNAEPKDTLQLDEDLKDESLELELDVEHHAETIEEEFPEVSEPSVKPAPLNTAEKMSSSEMDDHLNSSEIIDDEVFEVTKSEAASSSELDTEKASPAHAELELVDNTSKIETSESKPAASAEPPITKAAEVSSTNIKLHKKLETEQALSALINKSNLHSRQEHLKRTITLSILVALLIIGSALYFYIQINTETQEIFITDNNQAVINRDAENFAQPTQPVIDKVAANKVESAPVQSKPVKTKAKTASPVNKSTRSSSGISIEHTQKSDPVNALILEAYSEFYRENYSQADKLYNQVILREPNNRDALLGLSAIALKQQRYEYARQKYQALLKLNPRDSIAIAGLSSIQNSVDPQLDESQIKFMLKQNPDAAHLHFALGSLYSTDNKWPEAQAAYFSAWSAENKNADYAYNLAVSLDHLDKIDQALKYYNLSLQLKQASNGNFSTEIASARIQTLRESLQ